MPITLIFQIIAAIFSVMPKIKPAIQEAEALFCDKPQSGKEKLQHVLNVAADTLDATGQVMASVSKGGQQETWNQLNTALIPIVNHAVDEMKADGSILDKVSPSCPSN